MAALNMLYDPSFKREKKTCIGKHHPVTQVSLVSIFLLQSVMHLNTWITCFLAAVHHFCSHFLYSSILSSCWLCWWWGVHMLSSISWVLKRFYCTEPFLPKYVMFKLCLELKWLHMCHELKWLQLCHKVFVRQMDQIYFNHIEYNFLNSSCSGNFLLMTDLIRKRSELADAAPSSPQLFSADQDANETEWTALFPSFAMRLFSVPATRLHPL